MKYETTVGFAELNPTFDIVRRALAALLALVLGTAVALAIGLVFVYGAAMVGATLPAMLVAWAAIFGILVLLPFLVVRTMASVFTALEL
ncbi:MULTISPECIES: hypothetical protein [unclassified Haladaptatus]|uniref:hypothetical protein n=1 Tax=unclassified Haladaptatus TaxID=2622732 RepID=UPI00209C37F7|nr:MULTISPECIES: hypothetical protein [unclassified Haladaptatus]MCO8243023.1 hypothetical protein [Haladaptatus sp. AB643]MCO8252737.1 hypothetical protein [Haladaptatus sp. AB618]